MVSVNIMGVYSIYSGANVRTQLAQSRLPRNLAAAASMFSSDFFTLMQYSHTLVYIC